MLGKVAVLAVIVTGGMYLYDSGFFNTALTHKSHHGAADLYMKALQAHDLTLMKQRTRGSAVISCEGILNSVKNNPSQMTRYIVECGGAGSGNRQSGRALCYGSGGELYLEVALTLERFDDLWYVSEAGTRFLKNGT